MQDRSRTDAEDEAEIPILRIDPALKQKQRDRLQATRARRDARQVERTLAELKSAAAEPGRNLIEPILDCARARASEGEIVLSLQEVFGTYSEAPQF